MLNRKALACAAAATLLAMGGWAKADSNSANALSLSQPMLLDDVAATQPAPAPADKPLMLLLDAAGVGQSLKDANVTVGGYVEASWTVSDSSPPGNNITGRYFDFENQDLTLNQLDFYVDRSVDVSKNKFDIGGHFELIYGGDSRLIHSLGLLDYHGIYNVAPGNSASPDEQLDINQAYVDFAIPVGPDYGLRLRVGKFDTLLGYEVISPAGNQFYSHSFLFAYAIPLTNKGALATFTLNPSWTFDAGVTRGWDTSTEDDNDTVDFMGRATWTIDDKSALYVSLICGPDQPGDNDNYRTVLDVIYSRKLSDELTVAVNADYGYQVNGTNSGSDDQWYGVAGYAGYTIDSHFTLNGRLEYFNDDDGYRGLGTTVYEATLGLAITPFPDDAYASNLHFRPEVRYDYAKENVYDGGTDRSQATFGVDAYFTY